MFKEFLLNSITKDLKVLKRLSGKIPAEQMSFRPKENLRSMEELLQYMTLVATSTIGFWLNEKEQSDFRSYFMKISANSKLITASEYPAIFEEQVKNVHQLFEQITEEDLFQKDVTAPSGVTVKLGEGILETSVKWLAAYKMQLFLYIKMSTDLTLTTPDLWRKFED